MRTTDVEPCDQSPYRLVILYWTLQRPRIFELFLPQVLQISQNRLVDPFVGERIPQVANHLVDHALVQLNTHVDKQTSQTTEKHTRGTGFGTIFFEVISNI